MADKPDECAVKELFWRGFHTPAGLKSGSARPLMCSLTVPCAAMSHA